MVVAPLSYVEMKDQTMIFMCVSRIFLKKSACSQIIWKFSYNALIKHLSELKHKCDQDSLLQAKILLTADQEIQRWLKECSVAKEDVNNYLLNNLTSIVEDAAKGIFFITLPKTFIMTE